MTMGAGSTIKPGVISRLNGGKRHCLRVGMVHILPSPWSIFNPVDFSPLATTLFVQPFHHAFKPTPTIHKIPLIPPLAKGEIVIPLFGRRPIGPPSGA